MAQRQVDYVNIVAYARAIRRGVVVAKHGQALAVAHSHLGDERHHVVRNTGSIFAYQATRVGSEWVEIAQHAYLPLRIGMHEIGKDLLDHQRGAGIWIEH